MMPLSPRAAPDVAEEVLARAAAVALLVRGEQQVRTEERALEAVGLHHAELADDVARDPARGGRGERQDRHAAELLLEPAEPPVRRAGSRAPTPRCSAPRRRRPARRAPRRARRAGCPRAPRARRRPARTRRARRRCEALAPRRPQSSVELSTVARKPVRSSASTWSFISEMSGLTTSTVPGEDARRDLEGERLAGAGRHDADAVAPAEHGGDDLLLPGTEVRVAEDVAQDVARRGAGSGKMRVDGSGRYHAGRGGNSGSATSGHATPASPDVPASREVLPGSMARQGSDGRQNGTSCLRRSRCAWRAAAISSCVT